MVLVEVVVMVEQEVEFVEVPVQQVPVQVLVEKKVVEMEVVKEVLVDQVAKVWKEIEGVLSYCSDPHRPLANPLTGP